MQISIDSGLEISKNNILAPYRLATSYSTTAQRRRWCDGGGMHRVREDVLADLPLALAVPRRLREGVVLELLELRTRDRGGGDEGGCGERHHFVQGVLQAQLVAHPFRI